MGRPALAGSARKAFRFTGKERDGESGLTYHGSRYFAPWLGRWASTDLIHAPGPSPYWYVRSNPLRFVDPHWRGGGSPGRPT